MFKTSLFMLLFINILFAQTYPKFFSSLGTPLYKSDIAFEKLEFIDGLKDKITQYHISVEKNLKLADFLKQDPMRLEMEKKRYFKNLRALEDMHNKLLKQVNAALLKSIDSNDYKKFKKILDSDLKAILQNQIIRKRAMAYYVANRPKGRINSLDEYYKFLNTDANLFLHVESSMPAQTIIKDLYTTDGSIEETVISKNSHFAFNINTKHCLKVLDIKNFSHTGNTNTFLFTNDKCDLQNITRSKDGRYIYTSDMKNGFGILDISIPNELVLKGAYSKIRAIYSMASDDENLAFVVRKNNGLLILDIKNKNEPKLLANYNRGLKINSVDLDEKNSRLYLAHSKGLRVLDISNIGNPRSVLDIKDENGFRFVKISHKKELMYLSSKNDGIKVYDISDKENLSLKSSYLTYADAGQFIISKDENLIFISTFEGGVEQIDTKDCTKLKHIMTYKLDKKAIALNAVMDENEENLYISFTKFGLAKIKIFKEGN